LIVQFSRRGIAENVRLRFGVFMLRSVPSGRGFESRAGQKIIFQINYTRDVKSMIRVVESKQKDKRRWSMPIYIDSTYQKRKICDMDFWRCPNLEPNSRMRSSWWSKAHWLIGTQHSTAQPSESSIVSKNWLNPGKEKLMADRGIEKGCTEDLIRLKLYWNS
jgi:hypothetical protein